MNLHFTKEFPIKTERLVERAVHILYPGEGLARLLRLYQEMLRMIDDVLILYEADAKK